MASHKHEHRTGLAAIPVPADVTTSSGSLGGIPVVNVEVTGADTQGVIFYLLGGAYAIGTARLVRWTRIRLRAWRRNPAGHSRLPAGARAPASRRDRGRCRCLPGTTRQRRVPFSPRGCSDVALGRPDPVRAQRQRQSRGRPRAHPRRSRPASRRLSARRLPSREARQPDLRRPHRAAAASDPGRLTRDPAR
jgi:hypothetical protein